MNTTKTSEQTTGRSYAPSITNTSRVIGEVVMVDFGTLDKVEDMDEVEDILAVGETIENITYHSRASPTASMSYASCIACAHMMMIGMQRKIIRRTYRRQTNLAGSSYIMRQ